MSSEFGKLVKVSVFGESHGPAIGVVMDGLPAGEAIDLQALEAFLQRRAPGQRMTTQRKEPDTVRILSGMKDGKTCGTPLCAVIENQDVRSGDYVPFAHTPRPGHVDYTAAIRYHGAADLSGGGHFSGRLTAPMCIAGGICRQILERRGIFVGAHLSSVGNVPDVAFPLYPTKALFDELAVRPIPAISHKAAEAMEAEILRMAGEGNSLGGTVECAILGCKPGLGSPIFEGVESKLAQALFGIPAVKGVEFGDGFASTTSDGKQNNDEFLLENGEIKTNTNHCGGILGGITNGMPITVRTAFKPTPSIAQTQKTVDFSAMQNTEIQISGRHDPCVALRAVPVVEAVCACVTMDLMMEERGYGAF